MYSVHVHRGTTCIVSDLRVESIERMVARFLEIIARLQSRWLLQRLFCKYGFPRFSLMCSANSDGHIGLEI